MEVAILVDKKDAEYQFFFQKYKQKSIDEIPDSVFRKVNCDRTKIESLKFDNLYGIKNAKNHYKFIFDNNYNWLFYIHSSLTVHSTSRFLKNLIKEKTRKLNNNYKKRSYNYLGILIQTSFFNFKEEEILSNHINQIIIDEKDKNTSMFDKVYMVFYDAVFEVNTKLKSSNVCIVNKIMRDSVYSFSLKEKEMFD